jgi:hypothetical protein
VDNKTDGSSSSRGVHKLVSELKLVGKLFLVHSAYCRLRLIRHFKGDYLMGKITVTLTSITEKELHTYLAGKSDCTIDDVVEASVREYIEKKNNEHIGSNEVFYSSP